MPVYDYKCADHGLFHALAEVSAHAEPQCCPSCNKVSPRVIVIPPEVLAMSPTSKAAMEVNETASHEPIRFNKEEGLEAAHCGCGHRHHNRSIFTGEGVPDQDISALRQQVLYTAEGNKIFPSQRPWMISH